MRDLPLDKAKVVAEAFRIATLLSEFHADGLYSRPDVPTKVADEVAGDLAIVADRIRAAQAILDEVYPGFSALVAQADSEAEQRARQMLRKNHR